MAAVTCRQASPSSNPAQHPLLIRDRVVGGVGEGGGRGLSPLTFVKEKLEMIIKTKKVSKNAEEMSS